MKIQRLEPYIQGYAWGHSSWLQEFTHHPEAVGAGPWAEMWLGAHANGMTRVLRDDGTSQPMAELIAREPETTLGAGCDELPYLFKILAIAAPLSIQCHPSKAQAAAGYAREEAAGVPHTSPVRNYKDTNHKPEIFCALSPSIAMCGFRTVEEIGQLLESLIPETSRTYLSGILDPERPEGEVYRELLERILTLTGTERAAFMGMLAAEIASSSADSLEYRLVKRFLSIYPDDPSVLSPLYLNVLELAPGEALYQPAGELHAYVDGIGVELMASSDNVLRGGLTPKHIDTGELLEIVGFNHVDKQKTLPSETGNGSFVYDIPASEFILQVVDHADCGFTGHDSIEMVIQTEGTSVITCDDGTVEAAAGSCFLIPASVSDYRITCEGRLFLAGVPQP